MSGCQWVSEKRDPKSRPSLKAVRLLRGSFCDGTVALKNFSDDFLDHDEPGGAAVGPLAAKNMMEAVYQRWPDLQVSVEDILAEGDKVMVRNIWTATDKSTGRRISFHGFVLWRFANRKIVERWATLTSPAEM
jgi:predicted ester cyclase